LEECALRIPGKFYAGFDDLGEGLSRFLLDRQRFVLVITSGWLPGFDDLVKGLSLF